MRLLLILPRFGRKPAPPQETPTRRHGVGDTMRFRLFLAAACFVLVYGAIIGRLCCNAMPVASKIGFPSRPTIEWAASS